MDQKCLSYYYPQMPRWDEPKITAGPLSFCREPGRNVEHDTEWLRTQPTTTFSGVSWGYHY